MEDFKKKYLKYYNKYNNLLYGGSRRITHFNDLHDYEIEVLSYKCTDEGRFIYKQWNRIDLYKLKKDIFDKIKRNVPTLTGFTGTQICLSIFRDLNIHLPSPNASLDDDGDLQDPDCNTGQGYSIWTKSLWALYWTSALYKSNRSVEDIFEACTELQDEFLHNSLNNAKDSGNFNQLYDLLYNNFDIGSFQLVGNVEFEYI